MNNPGRVHWQEAKRVLRYLKGIRQNKFIYYKDDSSHRFTLYGYVDADWATDKDSRRSRAGYVFKLGRCILSWCSTLEPVQALSTAESELMAATIATKQCIYLRDLLNFLGHEQKKATVIFEDNAACIRLSKNSEFHKRTKHIDLKWFYVREMYLKGVVELLKVKSENNDADLFTKILPLKTFKRAVNKMFEYNYLK